MSFSFYSRYKITVKNCNNDIENEINTYLTSINNITIGAFYWRTWEDHQKVLSKLSLKYPEVEFTLCCENEYENVYWKKYFLNGKIQYSEGKITYKDSNWEPMQKDHTIYMVVESYDYEGDIILFYSLNYRLAKDYFDKLISSMNRDFDYIKDHLARIPGVTYRLDIIELDETTKSKITE